MQGKSIRGSAPSCHAIGPASQKLAQDDHSSNVVPLHVKKTGFSWYWAGAWKGCYVRILCSRHYNYLFEMKTVLPTLIAVLLLLHLGSAAVGSFDGETCDLSCETCFVGNDFRFCTSCNAIRHSSAPTDPYYQCLCPAGQFDGVNSVCQACLPRCATCVSVASNCQSCNGTNRGSTPACYCLNGFFDNSSNICQACHYSCYTCSSSSSCDTCNVQMNREFVQAGQPCGCASKYYDSGITNCTACHASCLFCSGTGPNDCLICNGTAGRTLSGTTCECQSPLKAVSLSSQQCCHYSCLTCSQSFICQTCNETLNRVFNATSQLCDCKPSYVASGELCLATCQITCQTCVANYTDRCATCEWSTRRVLNATSYQCQCPTGYFDNGVNAACAACHYSCATCSNSSTNCTSCPASRNSSALNGSCPCNNRYYDASSSMQNQSMCSSCRYYCATCAFGTNCSTCDAAKHRYFNSSTKLCDCGVGYFDDGEATENCALCDYRCLTCSGLSSCLTCSSGWGRSNPAANCPCQAGFYDNGVSVCVKCQYTCATCTNASLCATCSNSTFRALNTSNGLCSCLTGYYDAGYDSDASTPQACKPCRAGCASCTTSSNCLQCSNSSHFVNSTTFNCTACHSSCLTCSGSQSNNCLTCVFPKYLVSQMCVDVVCPFGKYVDLLGGCSACSELHANSLSCNIDEPLSCGKAYMLSEQECKPCSQVAGYALSEGECKEVCGDGLLISYQCDDGNTLNGDGCSSSCSIETGWRCDVISNRSSCTLTAAVELSLHSISKVPRKNVIRMTLRISLPLRLESDNFAVSFPSLSPGDYTTRVLPQSQAELLFISFEIEYKASLQGQRLALSYSKSRRLQQAHPRQLLSLSFSANFEVTTFPPANYTSSDSSSFYERTSAAIFVLSLVLFFLNLVIAPKRYALHSVSVAWLVPYLYFTLFYSTGYTTDWLSPMASDLKHISVYFGFSFGPCCSSDSILGTTSEVVSNAGAIIMTLLALWLVYLTIFLFTLKNKAEILAKAWRMAKYFLLTFHAFFFFPLAFAALNAFTKYTNANSVDTANLFIALAVLIGICAFMAYLWYATCTKFQASRKGTASSKQPSEKKSFADIQPNQSNLEHDESNIVIKMSNGRNDLTNATASQHALSLPDSARQEAAREEPFLPFDYCALYSANRHARYFLPLLMAKLFLFAIFSATLTANPFAMLLLHLLLSTAFLAFVCAVRPFESKLTQAKVIVTELLLVALQLPFAIYQNFGMKAVYLQSVESYIIVEVIFLLLAAVLFTIAEQYHIWKELLSQICGNLGVEGISRKVKDLPPLIVQPNPVKIEEVLQKPIHKEEKQQYKEADIIKLTHSAGLAQGFRRERTKTAAQKTSLEQFA